MFKIAVLPGDGVGSETVPEAIKVLKALEHRNEYHFGFNEGLIGGVALDAIGEPLPDETVELCINSDAILLGAVGGPKYDKLPVHLRPEAGGLLQLRKRLDLYANLRPVVAYNPLLEVSTLKKDIIKEVDIMIVRELTGGLYFGEKRREKKQQGETTYDTLVYSTYEIERLVRSGFELSMKRKKILHSVDKANVLESSRLWRETVNKLSKEYKEVEVVHMYVDNCSMQLIKYPKQFDVIITENMFGDILSDEASMLIGSIGMLPSASLSGNKGLFEPCHGSAPDIAGQNTANPIGTILSAAMMLKYSLGLESGAAIIEEAVINVLELGHRTIDIMQSGCKLCNTKELGDLVADEVSRLSL